jgi:hypothetical protein
LPQRLEYRYRAGDCHVERSSGRTQGDRDPSRCRGMYRRRRSGGFAAEQDRILCGKRKAVQRDRTGRGHQYEPRLWLATGEESSPGSMSPDIANGQVIENRPLQAAVVEQKSARLDQIDRYRKTGCEAQQRASILWYVGFEQGETQTNLRFSAAEWHAEQVNEGTLFRPIMRQSVA